MDGQYIFTIDFCTFYTPDYVFRSPYHLFMVENDHLLNQNSGRSTRFMGAAILFCFKIVHTKPTRNQFRVLRAPELIRQENLRNFREKLISGHSKMPRIASPPEISQLRAPEIFLSI